MRTPGSTPTANTIPEASLRRLSIYYHLLQAMTLTGVANVSCTQIAAALNLDPTQVRKDIEVTGMAGKPKVGYPLTALVRWIETFLGLNNTNEAVLVGVGSLGSLVSSRSSGVGAGSFLLRAGSESQRSNESAESEFRVHLSIPREAE